jgi:hypothetical protein
MGRGQVRTVWQLDRGAVVPRMLVAPQGLSVRSLKMLGKSVAQLKKGRASAPIDLSAFIGR